jgi:hypothetical protein
LTCHISQTYDSAPVIGQTISQYRIVENLGTGMVWSTRAEDTRLHRFIALMIGFIGSFANSRTLAAVAILLPALLLAADVDTGFHNAPASAQAAKNPYAGQEEAVQAGQKLYARNCLSCHGKIRRDCYCYDAMSSSGSE